MKLADFPIGSRIMYRAKDDWRTAVISRANEDSLTLIVCSPTGRTYRIKRKSEALVKKDSCILILIDPRKDDWRTNITDYDRRW